MMQKPEKMNETLAHGTHLRVLSESYLMNINMTGFRWFLKNLCILAHWTKVTSGLEGLTHEDLETSFTRGVCNFDTFRTYFGINHKFTKIC